MSEYIKKLWSQIHEFFGGLSPAKKMFTIIIATGLVVVIGGLFFWAGEKSFRPLMTNLNPEDSANIIRILREKRIPFKVDTTGKNIEVPPESLYDLRLELATMGLPQSSVIGYEIFDKQSLGTTSFVQKVNQKRALEGELMRTIATIQGVKRARVHLALPQKSTFIEDQKQPTASVVLDLAPGAPLSEKQVYGIGNLVASAVEGLEVANVVIVDSNGKTLSKNTRDPLVALTADQLDFQRKMEEDMEKRVEAMLSRVVGDGKVVARINADLDFARISETQTIYDADGAAIRSIEKDANSMKGVRPGPRGPAGAMSNTPDQPVALDDGQIRNDTNRAREITNYEVPQLTRRTQKPVGSIQKLSVAVVVDGKLVKETDAAGKVLAKVIPWSPEQLKEFEAVVSNSLGLDRKRGDTLEVRNMEFTHEDFTEADRIIAETEKRAYIKNLIIYAIAGLIIVLFFLFVVRPFIKWLTENTIDSVDSFLPQTIEELEKLQKNSNLPGLEEITPVLPEKMDPEKVEGEMIKEKVVTLVDSNPHKAALILKDWLKEEPVQKKKTEEDRTRTA